MWVMSDFEAGLSSPSSSPWWRRRRRDDGRLRVTARSQCLAEQAGDTPIILAEGGAGSRCCDGNGPKAYRVCSLIKKSPCE